MSRRILAARAVPLIALLVRCIPALAQGAAADVVLPDLSRLPEVAPPPDSADGSGSLRPDDPRVQRFLAHFQGPGRGRMAAYLARSGRYEPLIRQRFEAESLPSDLGYLAMVESGYRPDAVSRADAVGMWQLLRPTGRQYGLRVDSWVDERRDPVRATDAAARHLHDLRDRFGSFYLTAAAYNAGSGAVARGLERLPGDGPDSADAFFELGDRRLLARETRDYVPAFLAASLIAREPARYGFAAPTSRPLAYDTLVVTDATGLDVVARLGGVNPEAIRELNPQYLRLATPPSTRSVIRVPQGLGPEIETAYAALPPGERVQYLQHVVSPGDRLPDVAARYRVTPEEIHAANPGLQGSRLRAGTRLVIPTSAVPSAETARAAGWRPVPTALPVLVRHRVRRGDTLPAIAESYHVPLASLCRANALPADYPLRPGMYLRIPG
jgi:membrane-bound lytic murein transglycosylase D